MDNAVQESLAIFEVTEDGLLRVPRVNKDRDGERLFYLSYPRIEEARLAVSKYGLPHQVYVVLPMMQAIPDDRV